MIASLNWNGALHFSNLVHTALAIIANAKDIHINHIIQDIQSSLIQRQQTNEPL